MMQYDRGMRAAAERATFVIAHRVRLFVIAAALIVAACLFAVPVRVNAAELSFSPTAGTFAVGKEFSVKVMVDAGTESVNAADGTVSFDPEMLAVTSFTKDGSAFSLWTAEPTFSNSAGTVIFSGGTPTAFSGSKTVMIIKFKPKKIGTTKLSFSKGSILAADGKGTDVYKLGGEASYTFDEAKAEPEPETEEAPTEDEGGTPLAPIIDSKTFPKADLWYSTTTAIFSWKLTSDITGVRTLYSEKDEQTPSKPLPGVASSTVVTGIKDGTSYFYVQLRNSSGWGEVAKRQILLDTVPPAAFDVALIDGGEGGNHKLTFKTEDELSGIDRYEIFIGGVSMASVKAKDLVDGAYPLPPQDGGQQTVLIKAYDLAGNAREAKRDLDLPAVAKPTTKKASTEEVAPPQPFWTIERIMLILFAFIIGGLVAWMHSIRKIEHQNKMRVLARVSEMGDKNDRIFSAMREEFEQMVMDLDEKPQLTPAERNLLVNLKEVLDMSEELIDTSIDELKKEVKSQT